MFGYFGKLLRVDLTANSVNVQNIPEDTFRKYLGGVGIATRLLYDEMSGDTDPLGPQNVLVAFTGPFSATRIPSSGRHHIMARSPLTGLIGESNVGGSWAVHFKKTGFDGLVITGKAKKPVYLWIHDDGVEIRDADPIWGRDTYESTKWLYGETYAKATVAVIGQAGERLVPMASIAHIGQKHLVRAAARTGMGAVMGSKNLKAIVVFGTKKQKIFKEEILQKDIKATLPHIKEVTGTFSKYGTSGAVETYEKIGNFPIQNWCGSHWEGAVKISGVTMHDTILTGRRGCLGCPIACGRHIKISKGTYGPLDSEGPEYESIGTLGGLCLVDDLAAVSKANELCNRYGLDTMSVGSTIAFSMEAFEKGIITSEETGGIELTWGNAQALIEMVHKIGKREGIGRLMGEGSKKMAEALGGECIDFAIHVKGLEPSAHDPRRFFSQALNYATAARGACHNASWSHAYELSLTMPEIGIHEPADPYKIDVKAEFTAKLQNMQTANDTLIICRFAQVGKAVTLYNTMNWLNLVTDFDMELEEFMTVGERIFNLKRMYNNRIGISRKDDFLPPRFLTLNREAEDLTNQLPPIGSLLTDYYEYRGWGEDGLVTEDTIKELKLID